MHKADFFTDDWLFCFGKKKYRLFGGMSVNKFGGLRHVAARYFLSGNYGSGHRGCFLF